MDAGVKSAEVRPAFERNKNSLHFALNKLWMIRDALVLCIALLAGLTVFASGLQVQSLPHLGQVPSCLIVLVVLLLLDGSLRARRASESRAAIQFFAA